MIRLADYRLQNRHYEFDTITKKLTRIDLCLDQIVGCVSWQKTGIFRPRNLPVGCFYQDDCFSIFIGQKINVFSNPENLMISISERKFFSFKKRFKLFYEGKCLEEVDYFSISSSSEEWPDDYVDIFKYLSKLPFNNTKQLKFELSNQ